MKKRIIAWFMLVYYRILMVCGRGSKNGKGGEMAKMFSLNPCYSSKFLTFIFFSKGKSIPGYNKKSRNAYISAC